MGTELMEVAFWIRMAALPVQQVSLGGADVTARVVVIGVTDAEGAAVRMGLLTMRV